MTDEQIREMVAEIIEFAWTVAGDRVAGNGDVDEMVKLVRRHLQGARPESEKERGE